MPTMTYFVALGFKRPEDGGEIVARRRHFSASHPPFKNSCSGVVHVDRSPNKRRWSVTPWKRPRHSDSGRFLLRFNDAKDACLSECPLKSLEVRRTTSASHPSRVLFPSGNARYGLDARSLARVRRLWWVQKSALSARGTALSLPT